MRSSKSLFRHSWKIGGWRVAFSKETLIGVVNLNLSDTEKMFKTMRPGQAWRLGLGIPVLADPDPGTYEGIGRSLKGRGQEGNQGSRVVNESQTKVTFYKGRKNHFCLIFLVVSAGWEFKLTIGFPNKEIICKYSVVFIGTGGVDFLIIMGSRKQEQLSFCTKGSRMLHEETQG